MSPQVTDLPRLLQISLHDPVVRKIDIESFQITCAIPQLPGSRRVIDTWSALVHIAIHTAEPGIGRCEFGIDLGGANEKGQSCRSSRLRDSFSSHGVSLQCLE